MGVAQADFDYLRKLMQETSAIVLDPGKEYLAELRLGPVVLEHGLNSMGELFHRLRRHEDQTLRQRVLDVMTNNETWFFRDLAPFEALRLEVLPELLARRAYERNINIWSAACSSGQEPYSLAMLLKEQLPDSTGWKPSILATDFSVSVLERAMRGRYSRLEVNRGLPAQMLTRYFQPEGLEWVISPELRKNIAWRTMNLAQPWSEMPKFDVIFLRNVLIYFDVETKRDIFTRVRRVLKPDGCLFLGAAETTLNIDDAYERVPFQKTCYYRIRKDRV